MSEMNLDWDRKKVQFTSVFERVAEDISEEEKTEIWYYCCTYLLYLLIKLYCSFSSNCPNTEAS